ncbi:hypothetical protein HPB48_004413 [Haemaphysalis longicornis]|uniref:Cytochrome P450 n=1 Tax=Haemaphysalis longicornis TaxID=44386 RepID=A0A9J6GK27_HAELO|nr:hypothetical protein HPB48_004413 [Haemaphysalis longicornis]
MSHKPEFFIPFNTGRRSCPGDTFASMEVFLMITFLLQKYRILLAQPINVDLDSDDVYPFHMRHLKLRFFPRPHGCVSEL